ncbi:MAG: GTP cyclohydrolase II [Chthoniobacteraceae bacterium]
MNPVKTKATSSSLPKRRPPSPSPSSFARGAGSCASPCPAIAWWSSISRSWWRKIPSRTGPPSPSPWIGNTAPPPAFPPPTGRPPFAASPPRTAQAGDFARPGHIFPLRAVKGGVLQRPGHTEAAADLARLAGLQPVGMLCEIMNEDGTMARGPQLQAFAEKHGLHFITIAELIAYRRRTERIVTRTAEARLPTPHGLFTTHIYRSEIDGIEHIALVKGDLQSRESVLARVHSECFTGDILGSLRCDCGPQLEIALARIEAEGCGVVVYLRGHEGRGIGLTHKLQAYALQDAGLDTVEANLHLGLPVDARSYDIGAQILTDLGVRRIRLMSNNPAKFTELAGYDLQIVDRIPLRVPPNHENLAYLRTKQVKLGHALDMTEIAKGAACQVFQHAL